MCFVHTFPVEPEFFPVTTYYLPSVFSYIVFKRFVHAEYEDPFLIT